MHDVMISWNNL